MAKIFHVTIVGGGMTGLSAAFYLHKAVSEHRLPVRLTLLEACDRLGGKFLPSTGTASSLNKGPTPSWPARRPDRN